MGKTDRQARYDAAMNIALTIAGDVIDKVQTSDWYNSIIAYERGEFQKYFEEDKSISSQVFRILFSSNALDTKEQYIVPGSGLEDFYFENA